MGKQKDRYRAWSEAVINGWLEGDVEVTMDGWAEDCIRIGVDPFGDHWTVQGREALRELYENWSRDWSNKRVIKNEILCANKERGILHTWLSWTSKEGRELACTFISIVHLDENDQCSKYKEWNVVEVKEDEAQETG